MNNEIKGEDTSTSLSFFKDWVIPIAVALLIAVIIHKFLIFKVYIPSESMYPTLTKGDHLFVKKVYNYDKIKRQDIIVFNFKEDGKDELLIKRVIGLPGDTVKIDNQGKVFVNGEELNEPYIKNQSNLSGEFKVPEGRYFFLGDNRSNSKDSRFWKDPFIEKNEIQGKAFVRVYPFNRIGLF